MQGISAIAGACHCPMPVHSCTAVQCLSNGQLHAASHLVSCHIRPSSTCRELAVALHHPAPQRLHLCNHLRTSSSIQRPREVSAFAGDGENIEKFDEPLTEDEVEIAADLALEEGPSVNVKFVLEKECHFGQRFNVVGNDPLLGNWNVEAAVPMYWEDGHIWSAELDIPVGRQVEFKFVLTGKNNEVEWQPGCNRYFETENISPLVVTESWDLVDAPEEATAEEDVSPLASEALESADETSLIEETRELGRDAPASAEAVSADIDAKSLDEIISTEIISTEAVSADVDAKSVDEIMVKTGHDNVDIETPSEGAGNSSNNFSEVPMAENNVAATAVEAAMGIKG